MPEQEWGDTGANGVVADGARASGRRGGRMGSRGRRRVRRDGAVCGARFIGRAVLFAIVALTILTALAALLVWASGHAVRHRRGTIVAGLVVLLVLLLVARAVVRGVRGSAEPIADLMAATSRVETGDYGARGARPDPATCAASARAFNAMSARSRA